MTDTQQDRRAQRAARAAEKAGAKAARPWYQRKRWIAAMVVAGISIIGALGDDPAPTSRPTSAADAAEDGEPSGTDDVAAAVEDEPDPDPVVDDEADPAPAPPPKPKFHKRDYEDLSGREFAKITRDPDAHIGDQVLVFGEVFQFDSLTGPEQFLAHVDGDRDTEGEGFGFVSYDHNAVLGEGEFKRAKFDDVVEGDHFAAWVTVVGSFDYETQIGGSTTATGLMVDRIKVLPPVD